MNGDTDETQHLTAPLLKSGPRWLTRNTAAFGLMRLFSDMGHELVTAALPLFLATLGRGAATLGAIEGFSDAASSLVKMGMSFYSDRIGKRKAIIAAGYAATATLGAMAWATSWWQILILRLFAWTGRGARGPVRDALLTESVPPDVQGRAFGFVRGMDTVGAVAGPALALWLVGRLGVRHTFLIAFIPGALAALIAVLLVRDIRRAPQPELRLVASLRSLPRPFWRFVLAVGVFGLGNFAHTLLILRAATMLAPHYGQVRAGQLAIGLYTFHLGVLFAMAGIYIAIVDTVERAQTAGLLPENLRGTGYGALATINSIGDLLSSLVVGMLWSHVSVAAGFWYGAILTLLGAAGLFAVPGEFRPVAHES